MFEALLSTTLFWSTFAFSAGPFWTAIMEEAKHQPFLTIYRHYSIYFILGWLPLIATIGLITHTIGQINQQVLTALYFIGAGAIFYFAWKVIVQTRHEGKTFHFHWQSMLILSWLNPKAWLTIPSGFLAAQYTDQLWINILLFFFISIPPMYTALYLWGQLGRQGAKIAHHKISYMNALLLSLFGSYLLYEGFQQSRLLINT